MSNQKVTYHLRYRPGTILAARFGANLTTTGYPTREQAENVRLMCPNAESLEVVEAAAIPVQNKGSRRAFDGDLRENEGANEGGPAGASTPRGLSRTAKEFD